MRVVIVKNQVEFEEAVIEAEKVGMMLGSISNTGLPHGQFRLTFFPSDAFVKDETDARPSQDIE